jgi:hypothetical protein
MTFRGILKHCPFFFGFEVRVAAFRKFVSDHVQGFRSHELGKKWVPVRRKHVFDDGFTKLNSGQVLLQGVRIVFIDDNGQEGIILWAAF